LPTREPLVLFWVLYGFLGAAVLFAPANLQGEGVHAFLGVSAIVLSEVLVWSLRLLRRELSLTKNRIAKRNLT